MTVGYLVAFLAVKIFEPLYGISPLLVGLFLISGGNGILAPVVMNRALSKIDSSIAGAASGVYTTIAQVANALGIALIGTLFAMLIASHMSQAQAFAVLLLVSVLVSAGLSLTALLFPKAVKARQS